MPLTPPPIDATRACRVALAALAFSIAANACIAEEPAEFERAAAVSVLSPGGTTAEAQLWLDSTAGRSGVVRLRSEGIAAGAGWESPVLDRPTLEKGAHPEEFVVSTPMHSLDMPPPWLRLRTTYRWMATGVVDLGSEPETPAAPAQWLELAHHRLLGGEPEPALEALRGATRGDESEEVALGPLRLWLEARCLESLGRGEEMIRTYRRLAREHPDSLEAEEAREAVDFIAAHSLDEYLTRAASDTP